MVVGDDERLAQVAHNLVRNALAHTPPGTEVVVSTGVAQDDGVHQGDRQRPGHPAAVAGRVFDRFYQGDPSRSASGTGLGLAIVRAIAEALHGTAEVAASAAGRGHHRRQDPAGRRRTCRPAGQAVGRAPERSPQLH